MGKISLEPFTDNRPEDSCPIEKGENLAILTTEVVGRNYAEI